MTDMMCSYPRAKTATKIINTWHPRVFFIFITRIPFAIRWMQDQALQARYMRGLVSAAWHLSVQNTVQRSTGVSWTDQLLTADTSPVPPFSRPRHCCSSQEWSGSAWERSESGDRGQELVTVHCTVQEAESKRVRVSPGQDTDTSRRRLRLWPRWHPPVTHHHSLVIITFAVCDQ